jgi:soluble lytic murein transglycosylase-like protein
MRRAILIFAAFLVTASTARADYAVLRSGQRLHITGYERAGDKIRLTIAGGEIEIAAEDVVAIEPEDVFPAAPKPPATGPFGEAIQSAARKHGLDESLIASIIAAESNFNPKAVSRKRALGLMQLMPKTAAQFYVGNAFDPGQNVEAGAHYFKQLLDQFHGDLALALAAYNSGPRRVQRYGGVPPFTETRSYIRRVTAQFERRKKQAAGGFSAECISLAFPCAKSDWSQPLR